jgi:hypothetical protein
MSPSNPRKTKKYVGALEVALRIHLHEAERLDREMLYAMLIYNGYRWNEDTEHWYSTDSKPVSHNPRSIIRISAPKCAIADEATALKVLLELGEYEVLKESKPKPFANNPDMAVVFFEVWRSDDNDLHLGGK